MKDRKIKDNGKIEEIYYHYYDKIKNEAKHLEEFLNKKNDTTNYEVRVWTDTYFEHFWFGVNYKSFSIFGEQFKVFKRIDVGREGLYFPSSEKKYEEFVYSIREEVEKIDNDYVINKLGCIIE